mgnify:CR=1 FL=1
MSGLKHVCARLSNDSISCWGKNSNRELGIGNIQNQPLPVVLENISSLASRSVSEMLVDPANQDFRPKWGSHLHQLGAGAYDADDSSPWAAGIDWSFVSLSTPTVGCTDEGALNYDSNAEFEDGSCSVSYTHLRAHETQ